MKFKCENCNGTGMVLTSGAFEDSYICCSGYAFYCDRCEEEYDEEDLEEVQEDNHLCENCLEQ